MPIVADVYREGHAVKFGTASFEVAPQRDDELVIHGRTFSVTRCRHLEINAPPGEANMQYQVLVQDT
jgi:hypothetical protein